VVGPAPAVLIERFNFLYQKVGVENASGRALAISGVTFGGPVELTGQGDLFLEDVCCGELRIKGQRVWARQLNIEAPTTKIVNDGGRLWVLGYKTEREGTLIETRGGGRSEVLGGFCYATGNTKTTPMFTIDNASLSVTIGEASFNNRPFQQIVRETREGETKLLKRGAAPTRCNGTALPLYVGRIAER